MPSCALYTATTTTSGIESSAALPSKGLIDSSLKACVQKWSTSTQSGAPLSKAGQRPAAYHRSSKKAFSNAPCLGCNLLHKHRLSACRSRLWITKDRQGWQRAALPPSDEAAGERSEASTDDWLPEQWRERLASATSLYPLYVTTGGLLALVRPSAFQWFCQGGPGLYTLALGVIMGAMGLTISFEELWVVLTKRPGAVAFGCLAQYTIMPLLGFLISRLLSLSPSIAAGLILLSCCPGGSASNVVTFIARGDVPLSVVMTTFTTFGAVFVTPFLTQVLAGTFVPVDAVGLALSTLQVVLLPVLLGSSCKNLFPKAVSRIIPFAPLTAVLISSLLASSVFSANVPMLAAAAAAASAGPLLSGEEALGNVPMVVGAVLTLHAAGFALGYVVAQTTGFEEPQRRAISIEVGMQNSSLGVVLATKHFASPLAPLPAALSAILMNVMGSALAALWRHREKGLDQDELLGP